MYAGCGEHETAEVDKAAVEDNESVVFCLIKLDLMCIIVLGIILYLINRRSYIRAFYRRLFP